MDLLALASLYFSLETNRSAARSIRASMGLVRLVRRSGHEVLTSRCRLYQIGSSG